MRITGDGHATHLQALVYALNRSEGRILELGAGWYSTPVLAAVAEATMRPVLTVEADPVYRTWARERFGASLHQVIAPDDGIHPHQDHGDYWGLVLVDHGDGSRRAESVRRYGRSAMIVVHDTEPEAAAQYPGLEDVLASFTERRDFKALTPWTTVVR